MQTQVIVTHRIAGFHFWPDAPDEVAYLKSLHRHLFMFVVAWKVGHDDRDVEFHTAQKWIREAYDEPKNFGAMSCEMISKDLWSKLVDAGHAAPAWVEVWEDEECGARVEFQ